MSKVTPCHESALERLSGRRRAGTSRRHRACDISLTSIQRALQTLMIVAMRLRLPIWNLVLRSARQRLSLGRDERAVAANFR